MLEQLGLFNQVSTPKEPPLTPVRKVAKRETKVDVREVYFELGTSLVEIACKQKISQHALLLVPSEPILFVDMEHGIYMEVGRDSNGEFTPKLITRFEVQKAKYPGLITFVSEVNDRNRPWLKAKVTELAGYLAEDAFCLGFAGISDADIPFRNIVRTRAQGKHTKKSLSPSRADTRFSEAKIYCDDESPGLFRVESCRASEPKHIEEMPWDDGVRVTPRKSETKRMNYQAYQNMLIIRIGLRAYEGMTYSVRQVRPETTKSGEIKRIVYNIEHRNSNGSLSSSYEIAVEYDLVKDLLL